MGIALNAAAEVLVAVLEVENRALAAGDWTSVRGLAAAKREAGLAYEQALAGIDLEHRPAPARRMMRAAAERVAAAIEENERRRALLMLAKRREVELLAEGVVSLGWGKATPLRSGKRQRHGTQPAGWLDQAA
jgi:hypothetical protein